MKLNLKLTSSRDEIDCMATRIFRCGSCKHRVRFGEETCSRCKKKVTILNALPFYIFIVSALCVLLLFL